MKKKFVVVLLVFCYLLPIWSNGQSESAKSSEESVPVESGTLTIWSSGDELGRFVEGFNQIYPNITVDITVIPNADFLTKLTPTLASGKDVPDLFTGESNYVKYLVETPFWADLRQSPYNIAEHADDIWPYVLSVGTDSQGAVKALSWQASPGSVIYRRDFAKQVLGTDDPAEVHNFLSSNDEMLKTAEKLKKDGIRMFASWQDVWNMQFSNRESSWVKDGKLFIDDTMLDFMDMAKTIVENGYDLNVDPWAPEWMAAVEGNDTFSYVLPTWGYQFVVKPAANSTIGKWGLAEGPVPYVKGGTWLGMYKDSPNKEIAWKFFEYVCLNSDVQKDYAKQYGEYVALKSADQALASQSGEDVLAGQNLFTFYNDQMSKIPDDRMTAYDGQINTIFLSATKAYAAGQLTKDQAVTQFTSDVANAYPELQN